MTLSPLDQAILDRVSPDIGDEVVERLLTAVRERDDSYVSGLRTPVQLAEESPFAAYTLRALASGADENGLADFGAVVLLDSGRYLIHVDSFDAWLKSRNVRPCVRPRLSSVPRSGGRSGRQG